MRLVPLTETQKCKPIPGALQTAEAKGAVA